VKVYSIEVTTGDVTFAGTNANVFITIFGDQGDSGEKKLAKSETHSDKFERKQTDIFKMETADLGTLTHIRIRHDNSGISADWFLDRVVIRDDKQKYTFVCERWLSTSREDKKTERVLYEKNYTGPRMESSTTIRSSIGGSIANSKDLRSSSLKRISLENVNESPEGPTIPYTVILKTGKETDAGTSAQVFIRIIGKQKKDTGRIKLLLAKKKKFEPGSTETFSIDGIDVGDIRKIEIGHDGVSPGSGWLLKEIEIHTPLKGKSYFINVNEWLAVDKGDGLTTKTFYIDEATTKISTYKNCK
jgi:lipoxygenase homology domain-containing protein 1